MDPRHYRHGRRQATWLWRGAHGVPWPGVARFPILLKSVEAKSKLYELSPSLSLSFVFETWTSGLFDVLVDGKVAATRSHAERDPPCLLRLSLREKASESSLWISITDQKFWIYIRLIWQRLWGDMGIAVYAFVCFNPKAIFRSSAIRLSYEYRYATRVILLRWLRIFSSGFLDISTVYSWLLNLIISLIPQGIRFGILTHGKILSYQICSFSVFKFVLAVIRFSSLANLSFPV